MELIKESDEEENNVAEKQESGRKGKVLSLKKRLVKEDDNDDEDDIILVDNDVEKDKEGDEIKPSQETVKSAEDVIPSSQDLFSDTDSSSQKTEVEKDDKKVLDKFNRTPESSKVIIKDVKIILEKTPESEMKQQSISEEKLDLKKKTEIKDANDSSKGITIKEEVNSSGDESFSLQLNMSIINTTQNKQNQSFSSECSEKENLQPNKSLNVSKTVEKVDDDFCEPMEVDETIIDEEKKADEDKETGEKIAVSGDDVSDISKEMDIVSGKEPEEDSVKVEEKVVEEKSEKKEEVESVVLEEKGLSTKASEAEKQKEKAVEEISEDIVDVKNLEEIVEVEQKEKSVNEEKEQTESQEKASNGDEVTNEDHVEGTPKKVSKIVDLAKKEEETPKQTPKQNKSNSPNQEKIITQEETPKKGSEQKKLTSLGNKEEPKDENVEKTPNKVAKTQLETSKHEEIEAVEEQSTKESHQQGQKRKANDESDENLSEEELVEKSPRTLKKRCSLNVTNEEDQTEKKESPKKTALATSEENKRASLSSEEEPVVEEITKTQLNSPKQEKEEDGEESAKAQLETQERKTKDEDKVEEKAAEEAPGVNLNECVIADNESENGKDDNADRSLNTSTQKKRASLQASPKSATKEQKLAHSDNSVKEAKNRKSSSPSQKVSVKGKSRRSLKMQLKRLRERCFNDGFSDSEDENLMYRIEDMLNAMKKSGESTLSDSGDEDNEEEFVLVEAEEGEEDTPSEGSNDIIDVGEPINTTSSESSGSNDEYEKDSFITDDEAQDLLSGDEFDIYDNTTKKSKSPQKRQTRIIRPTESSEDETTVQPLLKTKESPRKSRIIRPTESSEEDIEVLTNEKDTSLLKSFTSVGNQTQELASETEVKKSVAILEGVKIEEIGSQQLITHITEAVGKFFADMQDDSSAVKINLSLDYSTTSCKDLDEMVNVSDVGEKKKKKKKRSSAGQKETDAETKRDREIAKLQEEIAQEERNKKKKENQVVLEEATTKKKKKLEKQGLPAEEENNADNTFVISKSERKTHKKLEKSQENNQPKVKQQPLVMKPVKRKQETVTEIPKKILKPSPSIKLNKSAETSILKQKPKTDPTKKFKLLPSTSNTVQDVKVDYFPNPLLSLLVDQEKKKKSKKASLLSADRSWSVEPVASPRLAKAESAWEVEPVADPKPSKNCLMAESNKRKKKKSKPTTARELIKSKDFKTQQLYESGRIKRMDTKKLLKKKLLK